MVRASKRILSLLLCFVLTVTIFGVCEFNSAVAVDAGGHRSMNWYGNKAIKVIWQSQKIASFWQLTLTSTSEYGTVNIKNGDYFHYDVYVDASSLDSDSCVGLEPLIGGVTTRDGNRAGLDDEGQPIHEQGWKPNRALKSWYHRRFKINQDMSGDLRLVFGGKMQVNAPIYFTNVCITDQYGMVKYVIYNGAQGIIDIAFHGGDDGNLGHFGVVETTLPSSVPGVSNITVNNSEPPPYSGETAYGPYLTAHPGWYCSVFYTNSSSDILSGESYRVSYDSGGNHYNLTGDFSQGYVVDGVYRYAIFFFLDKTVTSLECCANGHGSAVHKRVVIRVDANTTNIANTDSSKGTINTTLLCFANDGIAQRFFSNSTFDPNGALPGGSANPGFDWAGHYDKSSGGNQIVATNGTISSAKRAYVSTIYCQWKSLPLDFTNDTVTKTFSTSAQSATFNGAKNGTGNYTYSKVSGSFTVSGTSISIPAGTNAGTYSTVVKAVDNKSGSTAQKTVTIKINNASQSAPSVTGHNETYKGKGDGSITGTSTAMEYRKDGTSTYTACSGTSITGLAVGTYYVRLKAKTNYNASGDTKVVIGEGPQITVSVSPNNSNYGSTSGGGNYNYNASVTISATPKTGYHFVKWSDNNTNASRTFNVTSPVTLTATFEANTYSLSYNYNGGTAGSGTYKSSVAYDVAFATPLPTREGYTFAGWYITGMDTCRHNFAVHGQTPVANNDTEYQCSAAMTDFKMLRSTAGTVTFTAQWTPITYSVTYNLNGGSRGAENTYPDHGTFGVPFHVTIPTRAGYNFTGWRISGMDTTTHHYSHTTTPTVNNLTEFTTDPLDTEFLNLRATPGTVTFTATWNAIPYYINIHGYNYDTDVTVAGPYYINGSSQNFDLSSFVPADFPRKHFTGWQVTAQTQSGTCTVSGNTLTIPAGAYGDITIKSLWETIVPSFSVDDVNCDMGGTVSIPVRIDNINTDISSFVLDISYNSSYFTYTGYSLGTLGESLDYVVLNDATPGKITISAMNTRGIVTNGIILYLNFSTDLYTPVNQKYGFTTSVTEAFYKELDVPVPSVIGNAGSITVKPIPYDIFVQSADSHGTVSGGGRYLCYSEQTIVATPNVGYHFQYWMFNGEIVSTNASYTFNVPVGGGTYTAYFAPNTDTPYTVKHYKQNADGTYPSTPTDTDNLTGTTDTSVTPARKNYIGYTAPAGQAININGDGSATVSYYYTVHSYNISYNLAGGSFGASHPTTTKYDVEFTVSNPSRTAYNFVGWNITGMDGTTHFIGGASTTATFVEKTMATLFKNLTSVNGATVTFTAVWEKVTYNITFTPISGDSTETGSASPATYQIQDYNQTINLSASREGYSVTGWHITGAVVKNLDGSVKQFTIPAGVYGNINITCDWEIIQYDVKVSTEISPDYYIRNITYNIPFSVSVPGQRMGYEFSGWIISGMDHCVHYFDENTTTDDIFGPVVADEYKNLRSSPGEVLFVAEWVKLSYIIQLQDPEGTGGSVSPDRYVTPETDITVELTPSTRIGYNMKHWIISGAIELTLDASATSFIIPAGTTGNIIITIDWEPIKYNVILDYGTGTSSVIATYDSPMPSIAGSLPKKTGYDFDGYVRNPDGTGTKYYLFDGSSGHVWDIASDATLYVVWTPIHYFINYVGLTESEMQAGSFPTEILYDQTFNVSHPRRVGFEFRGWNITNMDGCVHTYGDKTTTESHLTSVYETSFKNLRSTTSTVIFEPQWEAIQYKLTILGLLDGVSSDNIEKYGTVDIYIDGRLVANDTSNYSVDWSYGSQYEIRDIKGILGHKYNGVVSGSIIGTISTGGVNIRLKFDSVQFSIVYDLSGGSTGQYAPAYMTYGTAFAVTNPTKEDCAFLAWTVTSGLNPETAMYGYNSNPSTPITDSSMQISAKFEVPLIYFLNLSATDGGTVTLTAVWVASGQRQLEIFVEESIIVIDEELAPHDQSDEQNAARLEAKALLESLKNDTSRPADIRLEEAQAAMFRIKTSLGMLDTVFQVNGSATAGSSTANVRLISTVGDLSRYKEVGFLVTIKGKDYTYVTTLCYLNIIDSTGDNPVEITADYINPDSAYFFTTVISSVPNSAFATGITVKAYAKPLVGEIIYGVEKTRTVNGLISASA